MVTADHVPHVSESKAIIDKEVPIKIPMHRFSFVFVQVEKSNIAFRDLIYYIYIIYIIYIINI